MLTLIVLGLASAVLLPQTAAVEELPAPREWVAFSADVRGEGPEGAFEGKFYRGDDGSTRMETGPVGGPTNRIVIVNLTRLEQYTCRKGCLTVSLEGKRDKTPPRMRKMPALTRIDKPIEGFEAYRFESGIVSTVIPALNFFAVQRVTAMGNEMYSNIRVGKQPSELFERPQ
jgi:hypothetical protein